MNTQNDRGTVRPRAEWQCRIRKCATYGWIIGRSHDRPELLFCLTHNGLTQYVPESEVTTR